MESISHHITPLVINSLRDRHTHKYTHTHTHTRTDNPHRINFKKPGTCRPQSGVHLVKKEDMDKSEKLCKQLRDQIVRERVETTAQGLV